MKDVDIVARLGVGNMWFDSRRKKFVTSPKRPDWLWGLPSILFNRHRGFFPVGKAARA